MRKRIHIERETGVMTIGESAKQICLKFIAKETMPMILVGDNGEYL